MRETWNVSKETNYRMNCTCRRDQGSTVGRSQKLSGSKNDLETCRKGVKQLKKYHESRKSLTTKQVLVRGEEELSSLTMSEWN